MRNPPADYLSDEFTTCTEWCRDQWEKAISAGDHEAAENYLQMHNMWERRDQ